MARGPLALIAGGLLALAVLAPLGAVIARADWPLRLAPGDWAAVRFTLLQAAVSAVLSVAAAIPLAAALARRRFPGRGAMLALMGAPFLLPGIVAVFGLLVIWGRSGLVSQALMGIGLGRIDIYGLTGVVLAHVFFNLPLATRLLLGGWGQVPGEHFRLAAQLGLGPRQRFLVIEAPILREVLPGALLLIFLLCAASFAVVLVLGGGPAATSIELAIFTAIRFEFDLGRAALLALVQVAVSLLAGLALMALGRPAGLGRGLGRMPALDWPGGGRDAVVIALGAAFLILPIGAVIWRGLGGLAEVAPLLWPAISLSLRIALLSTVLALALALALSFWLARRPGWAEVPVYLGLIISPFVLGTGAFLLIHPVADPFALVLPVVALVNAILSLPFAVRVLVPAIRRVEADYGRLSEGLGLSGWDRWQVVLWPALAAPMGFAAGVAMAFSLGDLGVVTLFAPPDQATLPLLMYRLMGSYRMEAAAGAGLVLLVLALAAFVICEKGGRLGPRL